jgi:hypothetical protein
MKGVGRPAARPALDRRAFPHRRAVRLLPRRRQSRRRGASLYALGYGRHEPAPQRVLPFFPAFLAGMNLVVLADDAFTFLLSWEFMSLPPGRWSWRTTATATTRAPATSIW